MGTDIHLGVERLENSTWVSCDEWEEEDDWLTIVNPFYSGRCYDLFSILANVRNGSGFAGVKTSEGFTPISSPRGLPPDVSQEFRKYQENWGADGHSHSFLTLEDLQSFDWTQKATKVGWVTPKEFARKKLEGKPREWCGASIGRGIWHLTELVFEDAFEQFCKGEETPWSLLWQDERGEKSRKKFNELLHFIGDEQPIAQISWEVSYHEACATFLAHTIPRLWRLGEPSSVRIVFFFDN